jgi:hypothetical protein
MRLHERDFSKALTPVEEAEWQELQEIRRPKPIPLFVKATSIRGYSKAVRHKSTLFPNNFLDVVELQEKDRLKSEVSAFEELLNSPGVDERKILNHINGNYRFFIIGSILKALPFGFGHHDAYLFPEFPLGNTYEVDYLLAGDSSDGFSFVFVEFEAPSGKITLASGDYGEVIRRGLRQVNKWKRWLAANYNCLIETFDKYRGSDVQLPPEFSRLDTTRLHYVVVAGRRRDFKETTYQARREEVMQGGPLLLHFDHVLDSASYIIGDSTY